jgi:uncharacterized protein YdeI (YjbR/CyaY-like superfamily)
VIIARGMKPQFFRTPAAFRAWLEMHHATTPELWVGFYKKASGKAGIGYLEAVDAALCFGWIDGIKKRIDALSYTHRFTARRPGSIWSAINTRRAGELRRQGLMAAAGLAALARRDEKKTAIYTYENRPAKLAAAYERVWKATRKAWTFFNAQPAGYQKLAKGWIMNAKKEETRRKRLQILIAASAKETRTRWM